MCKKLCEKCKKTYVATSEEVDILITEYIGEVGGGARSHIDNSSEIDAPEGRLQSGQEQAALRAEWLSKFGDANGQLSLRAANGCNVCQGTGYKGRLALHELLMATIPIKTIIRNRGTADEIRSCAFASGMRTLKQDGIEKVLSGRTDIKQVRAVCMV